MTVLDRLKMELANREYLTEEQYIQYLLENGLNEKSTYSKEMMQKQLLYTVIDILTAVMNDTDSMKSITTEFETIGRAYEYLQQRVQEIKNKIASIPDDEEEEPSCFSLMYTRGKYIRPISSDSISNLQ